MRPKAVQGKKKKYKKQKNKISDCFVRLTKTDHSPCSLLAFDFDLAQTDLVMKAVFNQASTQGKQFSIDPLGALKGGF